MWWPLKGPLGSEVRRNGLGRLLFGLLGEEDGLDVGEDASLGDGDAGEELVQLLVVPDGELEVTGDDACLLVVAGSIAGQLEDLRSQVLHHGGQVDGRAGPHALRVVALPQKTVDAPHGELEPCAAGAGLCLPLHLASLATARHLAFELREIVEMIRVCWLRAECEGDETSSLLL